VKVVRDAGMYCASGEVCVDWMFELVYRKEGSWFGMGFMLIGYHHLEAEEKATSNHLSQRVRRDQTTLSQENGAEGIPHHLQLRPILAKRIELSSRLDLPWYPACAG